MCTKHRVVSPHLHPDSTAKPSTSAQVQTSRPISAAEAARLGEYASGSSTSLPDGVSVSPSALADIRLTATLDVAWRAELMRLRQLLAVGDAGVLATSAQDRAPPKPRLQLFVATMSGVYRTFPTDQPARAPPPRPHRHRD